MQIAIVSLFPEMFIALQYGITGRALQQHLLQLSYFNPRDYTADNYHRVDDRPYGGGPGMVMQVKPLQQAIHAAKMQLGLETPVIYLSPQGKTLEQAGAEQLSQQTKLILLAGRYEGIDERLIQAEVDAEWSIGDYVVSGGELPAMVLIDAIVRLLPGALGDNESAQQDSFVQGLLDCPHYTRPESLPEGKVPTVLLSGDHAAIAQWRLQQSLGRTWLRRPELLEKRLLTEAERKLLAMFITESNRGKTDE